MTYINKKQVSAIQKHYNPVDWFNEHGDFIEIFANAKNYTIINSSEALDAKSNEKIIYDGLKVTYGEKNITLFQLLTIVCFRSNHWDAQYHIEYKILKKNIPYIRVAGDYYKVIEKETRYGTELKKLKTWKKETIIDDHGKEIIKDIPKFNDFTIIPDNLEYQEFHNNNYNLYAPFPHRPSSEPGDFPLINSLMDHIFKEQIDKGYIYMQVMYTMPKQILPILVLVSQERHTGKTTFLNLLELIFGDNYVLIKPDDLNNSFNHLYATKNVIAIDETVIEKNSAVEKLKTISTQKSLTVNQKHVSQYSIPFFGKVVMATNKEDEFMRIDSEEIRFWVRKINKIENLVTDYENKMVKEVPYFLNYLLSLPEVDTTKSRMVFTYDDIWTDKLEEVKNESRNWLHKDLLEIFKDVFLNCTAKQIYFSPKDIKEAFFKTNHNVNLHFIGKVLTKDMKVEKSEKSIRYVNFFGDTDNTTVGYPFILERKHFVTENEILEAESVVEKYRFDKNQANDLPF
jgi:hypothetical protein